LYGDFGIYKYVLQGFMRDVLITFVCFWWMSCWHRIRIDHL